MKVGVIGLGKLGLPVAVSMALQDNDVMGYDLDPARMTKEPQRYQETDPYGTGDFNTWLEESDLKFGTVEQVCEHAELIFVAVQTPHDPRYEGVTPLPLERVDFNYTWLRECVKTLSKHITRATPVVVISTCLPGTMRREILPHLNHHMCLVYNPFFIAMGTVMHDFLNPEFILLGIEDEDQWARGVVAKFYSRTLPQAERRWMSIESAELTKVAYNTFISAKLAFVNTLMEICDKIPRADVNQVTETLKCATDRLISGAYMTAGMGDGGGCHPRDNIAMSWLARELDLSFDMFDALMTARERHAQYLAEMVVDIAKQTSPPMQVVVLGTAFKPGTRIETGSPALLTSCYIRALGIEPVHEDPHVFPGQPRYQCTAVFLVGCRHPEFLEYRFPVGSIVVDPWRMILPQPGVVVLGIGGTARCSQ